MATLDFERFHEQWFQAGKRLLKDLHRALIIGDAPCSPGNEEEDTLSPLLKRFREFYGTYERASLQAIREDACHVMASCWRSPLEASFLWLGGWRPTMGVILVFSLMGMQIEHDFAKILEGADVPSMSGLSVKQLERLNHLQQSNRHVEDELSNRLAELQMSIADQEMTRATTAHPPPSESDDLTPLQLSMQQKLADLRDIVLEAEELRSKTVDEMLQILTPVQSLQFIVTSMEIGVAVRKLGVSAASHQVQGLLGSALDGDINKLKQTLSIEHDPSTSDGDGRTALHMAASKGHTECVDLLITAGADLNKKDNFGMTPLLVALRARHDSTADLLIDRGAAPQLDDPHGVELSLLPPFNPGCDWFTC